MQLQTENQTNTPQINTSKALNEYERGQRVLARLKKTGRKQVHAVRKFRRSKCRVSEAFKGKAPQLLDKIEAWVEVLEAKEKSRSIDKLVA